MTSILMLARAEKERGGPSVQLKPVMVSSLHRSIDGTLKARLAIVLRQRQVK
jgi:hypothetical protein